ncbi:hypothetical protein ACK35A_20650 [Aeromonas veronii]
MKVKQYKYRKTSPTRKKLADSMPADLTTKIPEKMTSNNECEPIASSYLATSVVEQPVPTLSSKVMFWRPRFLAESQWLQHIPFYFWLTDVLQPKTLVEPNLNSAVGYFAICQAIDKLNIDCVAYAAFGIQCDIPTVKAYNHEHYREFSYLVEQDEQTFINTLEDASIDLLLLKYDSVMLATEAGRVALQKKLTASAVVLIHGSKLSKERQLCTSLRNIYPSFELTQGQGLLLLCMGKQIPQRLEALINQGKDLSARRLIQNIYGRLGSANEDAWQCLVYERQIEELTTQLQAHTHHIQQLQGAKQTLADTLKQANQEIAAAKARQVELVATLAELGDETAANREQKHKLEQEKARLDKELGQIKHSRELAAADVARLQQDIDVRFDELAKLTQMLVDAEARLETVQQDNQALRDQLSQTQSNARAELEKANIEIQQTRQQITELSSKLSKQQTDNGRLKDSLNHTQQELVEVKALAAKRVDEVNQLKQQLSKAQSEHIKQLADKEQHLQQQQAELAQVSKELSKQRELGALLERDQQVAADKISTLARSELALQQSLNERFDELATLTNMLQQKEQKFEATITKMKATQLLQSKKRYRFSRKLLKVFNSKNKPKSDDDKFIEKIKNSSFFDAKWYCATYPEAIQHKAGPADHYYRLGYKKGFNPSLSFNNNWYLFQYQDVKSASINPLIHYLIFGKEEGRAIENV